MRLECRCSSSPLFGVTRTTIPFQVREVSFLHKPNSVHATLMPCNHTSAAILEQAGSFASLQDLHVVSDNGSCRGLASILTALSEPAHGTLKSISVSARMDPYTPKSHEEWLDSPLVPEMDELLAKFTRLEELSFDLPRAYHSTFHGAAWWQDELRSYLPRLQATVLIQVTFYGQRVVSVTVVELSAMHSLTQSRHRS